MAGTEQCLPWQDGEGLLPDHAERRGIVDGLVDVEQQDAAHLCCLPSTHPLRGPEIRALRKLLRDYPDTPYVFVSERRSPMTEATFRKIVARAGDAAELGMPIHPHMLRHSTGYKLANDGQDTRAIQLYLGHRNIQHTVLYTQLAADRFNGFWKD
ncbi:MAG: tyrosine-type recombinase/integrase [Rhodospirillaceae bacterium]